jgi:hypothetical protein
MQNVRAGNPTTTTPQDYYYNGMNEAAAMGNSEPDAVHGSTTNPMQRDCWWDPSSLSHPVCFKMWIISILQKADSIVVNVMPVKANFNNLICPPKSQYARDYI